MEGFLELPVFRACCSFSVLSVSTNPSLINTEPTCRRCEAGGHFWTFTRLYDDLLGCLSRSFPMWPQPGLARSQEIPAGRYSF